MGLERFLGGLNHIAAAELFFLHKASDCVYFTVSKIMSIRDLEQKYESDKMVSKE